MTASRDVSTRARAWRLFDELVSRAEPGNPWSRTGAVCSYGPDLVLLGRLLAVPVALDASTQSGVPAIALDVWVAHELRRAGFEPDEVWPRASAPRVLPREVAALLASLPQGLRSQLAGRVSRGITGVAGAEAKLLGKNYVKQVDVVMAAWDTGPQLMVSTKRMDSALGKNAANRVEESYGDAKNLRARYPQAALGFVYSLRAAALDLEPDKAEWLIDLLTKLGREDDAYDAVALILPVIANAPRRAVAATATADIDLGNGFAEAGVLPSPTDGGEAEELPAGDVQRILEELPEVTLRSADVPRELSPGRFLQVMIERVLDGSPVNFHRTARALRRDAPTVG